ncbi:MAG TPA: nucleotide exchange factor GrpE [Vicinamibacterales bacterium]|nr:nucleotide exchange factor GrpE [Vicinamibacterales bacterium]
MADNIHEPNDSAEQHDDSAAEAAPAAADTTDAIDELAKLRRERDDLFDRLLRKGAEFDNYRKRVDKERRDLTEWAAADVLSEVLAVLDDFERALQVEAPPEAQPYKTGVELIHRQLGEVLRKRGLTPLDTLGTDFDPHLHQAVAYEETAGAREGEVVGELRKGYRLGERLLRPALVRVAKAS